LPRSGLACDLRGRWPRSAVPIRSTCSDTTSSMTAVRSGRPGTQLQEDYRQKLVVVAAGEGPPAGPLSELTDTAATILGFADLAMQIRDNLESAFIDVMIAAPDRGNGIGAALARAAEDDLRAAGRSKLMSWTSHAGEAAADDPQAVVAPTGAGALSRTDPAVAFALAQGFVLKQTERHSSSSCQCRRTSWIPCAAGPVTAQPAIGCSPGRD